MLADLPGRENGRDGNGRQDGVQHAAFAQNDLQRRLDIHGHHRAGQFQFLESKVGEVFLQHPGCAAQAQDGRPLAAGAAKQLGLVQFGEHRFQFIGRVTGGVQRPDDAARAGASHGAHPVAFPFQAAEHADVGVTARSTAAESKCNIHSHLLWLLM